MANKFWSRDYLWLCRLSTSPLLWALHPTLSLLEDGKIFSGMPSPGKGSGKGGGGSPLLTKIQLGADTYTIGWLLPSLTDDCHWELTKISQGRNNVKGLVHPAHQHSATPVQRLLSGQGKLCIHRFCWIFTSRICFTLLILILTRSGYSVCFWRDLEAWASWKRNRQRRHACHKCTQLLVFVLILSWQCLYLGSAYNWKQKYMNDSRDNHKPSRMPECSSIFMLQRTISANTAGGVLGVSGSVWTTFISSKGHKIFKKSKLPSPFHIPSLRSVKDILYTWCLRRPTSDITIFCIAISDIAIPNIELSCHAISNIAISDIAISCIAIKDIAIQPAFDCFWPASVVSAPLGTPCLARPFLQPHTNLARWCDIFVTPLSIKHRQ